MRWISPSIDGSVPIPLLQTQYYALVCSSEWLFNDAHNESVAEQFRERVRHLKSLNKTEYDFWIVPEPKWLERYPEQARRIRRPCVALVSTDKDWIM